MNKRSYKRYLRTRHWRQYREKRKQAAGYRCQTCGSKIRLEVHHKTYERLGKERLSDTVVVCRQCHGKIHGRKS